jgi:lipid A ethanolaminephosphotransferase
VIAGVFVIVVAALAALMVLTAWGRLMKPLWITILIAAGVAQHFMLTYGVVMDTAMLANTMQTDPREMRDLLGWTFLANMVVVVAVPALALLVVPVRRTPWWPQLWRNAALFAGALALLLVASFAMYSRLAPMVRNHMHLRYIVNPIAGFTSAATVTLGPLSSQEQAARSDQRRRRARREPCGRRQAAVSRRRRRRDRPGGPLLAQRLPAPDEPRTRDRRRAELPRRALVRHRHPRFAAVHALAARQERVREAQRRAREPARPAAGGGARRALARQPVGLQGRLQSRADGVDVGPSGRRRGARCAATASASTMPLSSASTSGSPACPEERRRNGVVLVMHQMGSHGPAYYKRSAPAQKALPAECTNTTLGQCDREQLINAYDNTIVATDRFLAETIAWLKRRSADHAPRLVYMSDHGESLGELGIFLHGLPYAFAPRRAEARPFIAWFGAEHRGAARLDSACVGALLDTPYSPRQPVPQPSSALLDVTTPTYRRELDAFAPCRKGAAS